MKEQILQTLRELRTYALQKGYIIALFYHEEESYLMRFANSAVSLNTNEHLIRLDITAYDGEKRAGYQLITGLDKIAEMKLGIDTAAEMVHHAQPLSYQPTIPLFTESFADESGYDAALAKISNMQRLHHINQAVAGLETEEIKLSGIFANGTNIIAQINTRSEHTQFFRTADAQISVVLAHKMLKWEVSAGQSAHSMTDLEPAALRRDLAFMAAHYQNDMAQQIPVGRYDIVFGPAATAVMVNFMNWIGFNGGLMKRGYSFLKEENVGEKVFSDQFSLTDDPQQPATFPFKRDFMGVSRKAYPIIDKGIFRGFIWSQDEADEFGAKATGHTVGHNSLVIRGGDRHVHSLEELVNLPREKDLLFIPFLHYMNIVNPSQGIITASSRFGALLLKKDGSVVVPYNVRLTQSLLDIFGENVAWLSEAVTPCNVSNSYGPRNPTALIVPNYLCVRNLEISHANESY